MKSVSIKQKDFDDSYSSGPNTDATDEVKVKVAKDDPQANSDPT